MGDERKSPPKAAIEKRHRIREELERIKYGVDSISDVLYRDDPACQDLFLFDVLRMHYGSMRYGKRRAYKIMMEMDTTAYRRVRSLHESQKQWLIKRLDNQ